VINDKRYEIYKDLIGKHRTDKGFLDEGCDSILFSCLVAVDEDLDFDIDAAYDGKYYHRTAVDEDGICECYDPTNPKNNMGFIERIKYAYKDIHWDIIHSINANGKSFVPKDILKRFWKRCQPAGSTISKDMINGILWYAWRYKRLDIIQNLARNGKVQGYGSVSTVNLTVGLRAAIAYLEYKLGGRCRWWWFPLWFDIGLTPTNYEAHLQMINIALKQEVGFPLYPQEVAAMHRQAKRVPWNPLFLTIVGKLDEAKEAFNNPLLFTNERLPTNRDRKASWVIQRDSESDLSPVIDKPFKEHHGGDYIFAYWLYKKRRGDD